MRISPALAVLFLVTGCHRDLTVCRSESDGPACVDAASRDVAVDDSGSNDTAAEDAFADSAADVVADSPSSETTTDSGSADTADSSGACEAGTYSCASDGELKTCADGGVATVVKCPSVSTCDATNKRCSVCTPGSYRCSLRDRITCTSLGLETSVTCETPELCAASTGGACLAPACATGEVKCSGKSALRCNAGRTGFDSEMCAIGCSAGSCVSVVALAGGGHAQHFCALLSDGTVRCWGSAGSTGAIPGGGGIVYVPTPLPDITSAVQVAVSYQATGVRLADGTVRVAGGLIGANGTATGVSGVTGASDLALGNSHACWTGGGIVRCWGEGAIGQLGTGGTSNVTPPSFGTVTGFVPSGPLTIGALSSFVVVSGGARGWGLNNFGQLGVGDYADRLSPATTFAGAIQISAGLSSACARTSTGVTCAGLNDQGQLGDGTTLDRSSPVSVMSIGTSLDIAVGAYHACALLTDRTVRCWGKNDGGQLGNGGTMASSTAVIVAGVVAKDIAAVQNTTCALLTDSVTIKCWGSGEALGAGSSVGTTTTPVTVVW